MPFGRFTIINMMWDLDHNKEQIERAVQRIDSIKQIPSAERQDAIRFRGVLRGNSGADIAIMFNNKCPKTQMRSDICP